MVLMASLGTVISLWLSYRRVLNLQLPQKTELPSVAAARKSDSFPMEKDLEETYLTLSSHCTTANQTVCVEPCKQVRHGAVFSPGVNISIIQVGLSIHHIFSLENLGLPLGTGISVIVGRVFSNILNATFNRTMKNLRTSSVKYT